VTNLKHEPELERCADGRTCGRHLSLYGQGGPRGPCSRSYAPGTSLAILADRGNHRVVAKTTPEPAEPPILGSVSYTKWDDGQVTSTYQYGDEEQVLLVVDPAWFERNFGPVWKPAAA
jgi:hypothetical protein